MIRLALVGYGKIAQDQHIPNILRHQALELTALVSTSGRGPETYPVYRTLDALLAQEKIDALVIATPARPRAALARRALEAGLHVFLEKPPAVTLGDVEMLAQLADRQKCTLFTSWHAQANPAVAIAADYVQAEGLAHMDISWCEDVEQWHPGQQWIWQAGGFGVMDAGMNALSIASRLCRHNICVEKSSFLMHSAGLQPLRASLLARSANGRISGLFDWTHKGKAQWTIEITTQMDNIILLDQGGARLFYNAQNIVQSQDEHSEYHALYAAFIDHIARGRSYVDTQPLRIVADMWLMADHLDA